MLHSFDFNKITNEGLSKKRSERWISQNGEIRKLQSCSVRFQDRTELDQQLPKHVLVFTALPYISQTARNTMSILCQNCKRKKTKRHVQLTLRFSWNISHKVKTILALTWNKKVSKKSSLKYLGIKRLLHGTRSTHSTVDNGKQILQRI